MFCTQTVSKNAFVFTCVGLIDYFTTLFFDVTTACLDTEDHADNKVAHSMLQNLLDTLHSMFKYVSEVVRKALQVILVTPITGKF